MNDSGSPKLRLLNGTIGILTLRNGSNDNFLKTHHTSDFDVPKSNPHGEDEDRNCKSLVNPKSFT